MIQSVEAEFAAKVAEGDFSVRDFRFGSGQHLAELRLHWRTLGTPARNERGEINNAILLLHSTNSSGAQFLQSSFANPLFNPGKLLDTNRNFIILPDAIGHGSSSKPSDGLRARFPRYDYGDMVAAQHRIVTDYFGVSRLRLVLGTSMGGMHAFLWGATWPDSIAALMPIACLPGPIAGYNRIWRTHAIDAIRSDPSWNDGEYTECPKAGIRTAVALVKAISGSARQLFNSYPTSAAAECYARQFMDERLARFDANDMLYALDASRSYDPSSSIEAIGAPTTWVNFADDLVNPASLGIAETYARRLPNAVFVQVPESPDTCGHESQLHADLWSHHLAGLLRRTS